MDNSAHRLKQFISNQNLSVIAFETEIGATKGVIAKHIKNGTGFNIQVAEKIGEKFPNLNCNWWLTGRGEMLVGQASTGIDESIKHQLTELRKETDYLRTKLAEADRGFRELYQEMKAKEAAWAAEKNTAAGGAPHQLKRS